MGCLPRTGISSRTPVLDIQVCTAFTFFIETCNSRKEKSNCWHWVVDFVTRSEMADGRRFGKEVTLLGWVVTGDMTVFFAKLWRIWWDPIHQNLLESSWTVHSTGWLISSGFSLLSFLSKNHHLIICCWHCYQLPVYSACPFLSSTLCIYFNIFKYWKVFPVV